MELEDDRYVEARRRTDSSREKMVAKYSKNHEIDRFEVSDIVTFKLPRGTRTPADYKRLFGRVLGVPQQDRYEIQNSVWSNQSSPTDKRASTGCYPSS